MPKLSRSNCQFSWTRLLKKVEGFVSYVSFPFSLSFGRMSLAAPLSAMTNTGTSMAGMR